MKRFFELRYQEFNWHPVELIKEEGELEFFKLLSDNDSISLKKGEFMKRGISINPIHIERLGFFTEQEGYVDRNGIMIIPVYNRTGKDLQNLILEFFGYTIFKKNDHTKMVIKFKNVFEKLNSGKYTKEDVETEFDSVYSLTELFEKLFELSIEFNEREVIIGK